MYIDNYLLIIYLPLESTQIRVYHIPSFVEIHEHKNQEHTLAPFHEHGLWCHRQITFYFQFLVFQLQHLCCWKSQEKYEHEICQHWYPKNWFICKYQADVLQYQSIVLKTEYMYYLQLQVLSEWYNKYTLVFVMYNNVYVGNYFTHYYIQELNILILSIL